MKIGASLLPEGGFIHFALMKQGQKEGRKEKEALEEDDFLVLLGASPSVD